MTDPEAAPNSPKNIWHNAGHAVAIYRPGAENARADSESRPICAGVTKPALRLGQSRPRVLPKLPDRCPLAPYFLLVTIATTAALQSSPRLAMAFLMQVTFCMRPLVPHCCFSMSPLHVFLAAATSANLVLHTSERSHRTCVARRACVAERFTSITVEQT